MVTQKEHKAPLALYRTYRPSSFKEVRGQEQVVSVLEAAVKKGELAHAYLFAGGRGTGKTSMARLLARAVGTADEDVYEIDAASNRQVDDARTLREGVATLPFSSRYKFYILDEVHMFTRESWNTLLKTLEEPPAHVVFVLATTELDRVPETIASRCQTFHFKKPSHEVLKKLVLDVAKAEGVSLAPAGAELIALVGEGSFRDTLGVLQKALTISADTKLSEEEIGRVIGAPPSALVNVFLEAVAKADVEAALSAFHTAVAGGAEPSVFIMLAVAKVRGVLLMRFAPGMKAELAEQYSEDDFARIVKLAGKEGARVNSHMLAELLTALIETPRAPVPSLPLELALYRLHEKVA